MSTPNPLNRNYPSEQVQRRTNYWHVTVYILIHIAHLVDDKLALHGEARAAVMGQLEQFINIIKGHILDEPEFHAYFYDQYSLARIFNVKNKYDVSHTYRNELDLIKAVVSTVEQLSSRFLYLDRDRYAEYRSEAMIIFQGHLERLRSKGIDIPMIYGDVAEEVKQDEVEEEEKEEEEEEEEEEEKEEVKQEDRGVGGVEVGGVGGVYIHSSDGQVHVSLSEMNTALKEMEIDENKEVEVDEESLFKKLLQILQNNKNHGNNNNNNN